ncbi:MAG: putative methyltransferase [Promethearchaeota archaeon CR_4]|nr:MAG: putative methyltransferase [Candidatus Lokiarchaeota archaeon CR_4]
MGCSEIAHYLYHQLGIEELRGRLIKYTRATFQLLPFLQHPRILDIGCGTGSSTLALANLSLGELVGIDIDQQAINLLQEKVKQQDLAARVQVIHNSLEKLSFPPESFDIIWEEGVIHLLDLRQVLAIIQRLLKTRGFFVIHETKAWLEQHRDQFVNTGFYFWGHLLLPEKVWWTEYYAVLEKRIDNLLRTQDTSIDHLMMQKYVDEIELVKQEPYKFDCGFYILRRR